jgi:inorganic pyrophosphatase
MDISKLKTGKNVPEEVNVVVEIPQGGYIKYEMDKDSGFVEVDRFAFTAMAYPFNYGFIPNTLAQDGDPTDVLVISTYPVNPGCVIAVRPVGMLEMEDESGVDTKILAVPTKKIDPFYAHVEEIEDLGEAVKNKIRHFFERYKELEPGKWVKLKDFKDRKAAYADITASMKK